MKIWEILLWWDCTPNNSNTRKQHLHLVLEWCCKIWHRIHKSFFRFCHARWYQRRRNSIWERRQFRLKWGKESPDDSVFVIYICPKVLNIGIGIALIFCSFKKKHLSVHSEDLMNNPRKLKFKITCPMLCISTPQPICLHAITPSPRWPWTIFLTGFPLSRVVRFSHSPRGWADDEEKAPLALERDQRRVVFAIVLVLFCHVCITTFWNLSSFFVDFLFCCFPIVLIPHFLTALSMTLTNLTTLPLTLTSSTLVIQLHTIPVTFPPLRSSFHSTPFPFPSVLGSCTCYYLRL